MCGKRQKKMDAVGELIKSGQLLTDATEIGHLKSGDLLQQLQTWIHLKTIRMQVNNRHLLKGSAAAKVADKERLRSLISMMPLSREALPLSTVLHHPISSKKTVLVQQ